LLRLAYPAMPGVGRLHLLVVVRLGEFGLAAWLLAHGARTVPWRHRQEAIMVRILIPVALGLVAVVTTVGVVFVVGMRTKSPTVLSAVRRLNRRFFNPHQMRTAGTPGAYASVIRHRGRTSGRHYVTPVGPTRTADGFVIALPYGTQADWLRNVVHHGFATVVHEGATYDVDSPQVVPTTSVIDELPSGEGRLLRRFNVSQCLRLRVVTRVDAIVAADR
jgi:hypothetical protein